MKICRVTIKNFRGISSGTVHLNDDTLLVGGNAAGKSKVCEAIDLALGLERLYRRPVVDEYDFYQSAYRASPESENDEEPEVFVEVVLSGLSEEATRRFRNHLRPWSTDDQDFAAPAQQGSGDLVDG